MTLELGFWFLPAALSGVHTEGSVFHQVQYVINVVVQSKKKRASELVGGRITHGWPVRDEVGEVKATVAAACEGPTCC